MTSFIPISECCVRGSVLPGTPRGEIQRAGTDGVTVDRYVARPAGEVKDAKTCVVLFYDVFGFQPNAKLIADTYADKLGVPVFVPDYMPNALPATALDGAVEMYPGQLANRSWLSSALSKIGMLRLLPYIPGIIDWSACPLVDKAMKDITDAGYTSIGGVGFCRGGSMLTYLLAKGGECPLTAAAIFHPEYTPDRYPAFTKPCVFLLAENDPYIYGERIDAVRNAFKDDPEAVVVFPDTVHGFAARPAFEHKGMMEAFHKANGVAISFLAKHLAV